MKRIFLAFLLAFSAGAFAAGNDVAVDQRNPGDTGWVVRLMPSPVTEGFLMFNPSTIRPQWTTLGAGLMVSGGQLTGFDGAWTSITGKPSSFAPSAHTHDAADVVSGVLADGRIPSLAISKTTGLQAALDGKFGSPGGNTAQYLRGDGSLFTFPTNLSSFTNGPGYLTSATAASTYATQAALAGKANSATTLVGYGITDAYPLSGNPSGFLSSAVAASTYATQAALGAKANSATTLDGYGITDAYPLSGNPSGFLTAVTSGQITTALGFTPYNATNPAGYLTSVTAASTYATQAALATKFTTPTGTTAQYVRGDGSLATLPAPGAGTVTSVAAGTGLSGGTITASGTISLPNVGTAGTYSGVTTDAQGRVTAGSTRSINDAPARSLVTTTAATGFQVSATRDARVCYEGSFATTSTIGGPASVSVFLETADTNSTTAGDWTTKARQTYTNNITLAVVLNQVQSNNWTMCRTIPAGKFVRIRAGSISGTASATINAEQQEVLY